eukprot:3097891-Rhodomonas_salina.1
MARTLLGLPEDHIIFCNFGRLGRVEPELVRAWAGILHSVPTSILCLLERPVIAGIRLQDQFRRAGIDAGRIRFLPPLQPKREHLAQMAAADFFLDTVTYNGHTRVSDALWAWLPVVTCPGREWLSRVATSLLSAAGLTELVTKDLSAYQQLATSFAQDP